MAFVWYRYPKQLRPFLLTETEQCVSFAGNHWDLVFEMFWCQVAIVALLQQLHRIRRYDGAFRMAEQEYKHYGLGYFNFWLENVDL